MSEAVAVAAPTPKKSPKKTPRKSGGVKKVASHPTYAQMVNMAVKNLKDRKGSSKAAILKYILQNYKVGDNIKSINAHLRAALKRGVTAGKLKQVKGSGASGSFRLADAAAKTGEKKRVPKKKTTVKKAVKPAGEKKTPKAKKPKSPKKAKSPKKPKATPKKAAAPKKARKTPTKKSPSKAKKSPKKTPKRK